MTGNYCTTIQHSEITVQDLRITINADDKVKFLLWLIDDHVGFEIYPKLVVAWNKF